MDFLGPQWFRFARFCNAKQDTPAFRFSQLQNGLFRPTSVSFHTVSQCETGHFLLPFPSTAEWIFLSHIGFVSHGFAMRNRPLLASVSLNCKMDFFHTLVLFRTVSQCKIGHVWLPFPSTAGWTFLSHIGFVSHGFAVRNTLIS